MARRHSASDHVITKYETMDSEGKRLGQVLEPKQRSRSMDSLVRTENYDTGYDTATPSRSGSIQSISNSEKTDVLVKQLKNQLIEENTLSEKVHSQNSDKIGPSTLSPSIDQHRSREKIRLGEGERQDAKRIPAEVKRLEQIQLQEKRKTEEKENRLHAERKEAAIKRLEKKKRIRETAERERLQELEEQRRHQKILEEQKRLVEQSLVRANGGQNNVNDIQNSHSQPLPINTGQPEGHAGIQEYLGDDVSSDGSWTGASNGDVEFAPGYGQDQYYDQSGLHIVDRNGLPVSNVPEPVEINQHDARQNDVHMHDYRNDQLDYSQPEDSQSENMQPDNQIGHGDPNY